MQSGTVTKSEQSKRHMHATHAITTTSKTVKKLKQTSNNVRNHCEIENQENIT